MNPTSSPPASPFEPEQLGRRLRYWREREGRKNFVTFLVGAGFSRSVDIPTAGEIVKELNEEAKSNPALENLKPKPAGVSEYAHLMGELGSAGERFNRVKRWVDRARDQQGRLRINWSHLLLASMVEHGYIRQILTVNFDPLIVEALAVTGQPIRTYDLSAAQRFAPGTLDAGCVIHLHGQMHSLLLINTQEEIGRLRGLYRPVLEDALRESLLIVAGYSGECDPVLDTLAGLPTVRYGTWWSHYSRSGRRPGDGVQRLLERHGGDVHLATGDDTDTFMDRMVLQGMQLELPDEVLTPVTAMRRTLERITAVPPRPIPAPNPVETAVAQLQRAEQLIKPARRIPREPAQPSSPDDTTNDLLKDMTTLRGLLQIQLASSTGNWTRLDELARFVAPDPSSRVSQALGDGFLTQGSARAIQGDLHHGSELIQKASRFGVTLKMAPWLPTAEGNILVQQAKLKGDTPDADRLFGEAGAKYAEALRIKPDTHEALYNWGNALSEQAKLKGNTPDADRLFAEAGAKYAQALRIKPDKHGALNNGGTALFEQAKLKGNTPDADRLFGEAGAKYAEALRIKPDMHETLNNWGTALLEQAKLKGNTPDAERLFVEAKAKYAEALRIKPDRHETLNNWGAALLEQAKLKGDTPEADRLFGEAGAKLAQALRIEPGFADAHMNLACLAALGRQPAESVEHLQRWRQHDPGARKRRLDNERDFDPIRTEAAFLALRATLPD
ncbi:MAG: SIR2 family protein [Planctomycetes bacterium]|nr:SIR2 family protein [Planctomycetota bacterium]